MKHDILTTWSLRYHRQEKRSNPRNLKGIKKVIFFAHYAKYWNTQEALDYLKIVNYGKYKYS